MRLKPSAKALWRLASSTQSRHVVRNAVRNALLDPLQAALAAFQAATAEARAAAGAAQAAVSSAQAIAAEVKLAAVEARAAAAEARAVVAGTAVGAAGDDAFEIAADDGSVFLPCSEREIARWNKEWFAYLAQEWDVQLTPYSAYGDKPGLPDHSERLLELCIGGSPPLSLYCDKDAILGRRVMELGCGCGNLGKHLARWAQSYLGVDYSTLALKIARLVSPANATYVHAADHAQLQPLMGGIDTAVGRFFFIHQNMKLARRVLRFAQAMLADGGRLYADFYWPNPAVEQARVLSPHDPLSAKDPSCTFAYGPEHVRELAQGTAFEVVREVVHPGMQRRYVVFQKRAQGRA